MSGRTAAVILAAGAGTRMRSAIPKPLHAVAGRPMIDYVIDGIDSVSPEQVIVVLSPELNANNDLVAHLQLCLGDRLGIAIQHQPLGTGDALRTASELIHEVDRVAVLFADHPLLEPSSIDGLLETLSSSPDTVLGLLTCTLADGGAYGRIDRDETGAIRRIVERKDDDPALRRGATEVNTGMMAIDRAWLAKAVSRLTTSPATDEVYLTQLAELAREDQLRIDSFAGNERDLTGINDRVDLEVAESMMQERLRENLQRNGVTFINGATTTLTSNISIAPDVTIEQGCVLRSGTTVDSGSVIGPDAVLDRASIGRNCRIVASFITDSTIEDESDVGPFSHIRGGSIIESGVHIGNFSEVKNSRIAPGVRVGHFGYLGDATIGPNTNIGAGVVTCNYDGVSKHQTRIGSNAFIGSDTMLVAPVEIGDDAVTGAGSVVTRNVSNGERVAGVPARPLPSKREVRGDN